MAAVVIGLTVVGWVTLLGFVAPHHYPLGYSSDGKVKLYTVGLGMLAYTLGLRHAFDADHIAAIDNTTRKLMAQKKRPLSVGFWFSLGHSSVVFALCVLLAVGVKSLVSQVSNDSSSLQHYTGLFGTLVSGTFLFILGLINLVVLVGIVKVFTRMRQGHFNEDELETHLDNRGFMNRLLKGTTKAVEKPWQMYPVGILFGLGFDTATEVSLLVLAGGAAAFALPWYAIMVLPILFAAGMCLFDTIDGCFMNFAYDWAFSQPVRKVFYNITVTTLSVFVALVIGTIELISVLSGQLNIESGPVAWIGNVDLNLVGYVIVAAFVVTWAVALAVWRWGRVEERWGAALIPSLAPAPEAD